MVMLESEVKEIYICTVLDLRAATYATLHVQISQIAQRHFACPPEGNVRYAPAEAAAWACRRASCGAADGGGGGQRGTAERHIPINNHVIISAWLSCLLTD